MRYDTEELRKLARRILPRAQTNLRKHGYLEPVGLIVRPDGFIDTVTFQWQTLGEKRKAQRDFQMELLKRNAVAAVIVSETWVKFADDGPLDLSDRTRSVRDMPGRKDAIMVEAGSPCSRVAIVQTFAKLEGGKVSFDDPREFTPLTGELTSEFLDAIWPVREEGGPIWH